MTSKKQKVHTGYIPPESDKYVSKGSLKPLRGSVEDKDKILHLMDELPTILSV